MKFISQDKIFTNTIKSLVGSHISRNDFFGDFTFIESNVKEDNVYKLDNVRTSATRNTSFYHDDGFGVDLYPNNEYIYFGDTKNMPYGDKTIDELKVLSSNIIDSSLLVNLFLYIYAYNHDTLISDMLLSLVKYA